MKNSINKAEITFNHCLADDYGFHDGFFNFVVLIDDIAYDIQCFADEDAVDFNDCGYDWGLCRDCNARLAKVVGWDGVLALLEKGYKEYKAGEIDHD